MTDGLEEMGLPPLGHNQPPPDDGKPLDKVALFDEVDKRVENANRWRAERETITDAEMAGQAQKSVDQLRGLRTDLGHCLRRERQPLDDAVEAIKIVYRVPMRSVDICLEGLERILRDWLKRDRERIEAERIERERLAEIARADAEHLDQLARAPGSTVQAQILAEEARERAAELTAAASRKERAQVKGDFAAKAMSLHSNWRARVIDPPLALLHFQHHPKVRKAALDAIEKVASKEAQKAKDPSKAPAGIEYFNDERAQ